MHEAAVYQTPHVLSRGDDGATPGTDLAGCTQLILFRVEAEAVALAVFLLLKLAIAFVVLLGHRRSVHLLNALFISAQELFFAVLRR
jgi:hypothetical protein